MKELSIEQKAQRYDEALKAVKYLKDVNSSDEGILNWVNDNFPELKESEESEDERIRQILITKTEKWYEAALENNVIQDIKDSADAITWLEKQGEKKDCYTKQELIDMGFSFTLNGDIVTPDEMMEDIKKYLSWKEKQGEQKPAWHEDDLTDTERVILNFAMYFHEDRCKPESEWQDEVKMLRDNISSIIKPAWSEEDENEVAILETYIRTNAWSDSHIDRALDIVDELVNKLKSLKDRVQPQSDVEFEKTITEIKTFIAKCNGFNRENRTKVFRMIDSLKPQNQWKPSEEQLKSLKEVIDVGHFTSYPNALETLYEQLKKLIDSIKPRYTWKPSDEQIEALDDAIAICSERDYQTECMLDDLRNDLKKL